MGCLYCAAGDAPEDLVGDGVKSHTVTIPCGPDAIQAAALVLASAGISDFRTKLVQELARLEPSSRLEPSEIPGFQEAIAAALHLVIHHQP